MQKELVKEYTATIEDYIGKAKVTIVDVLPYEIDKEKSELAGGTYDKDTKTITWESTIEDIDSYQDKGNQITISKTITVVYKEVDTSKEKLTNKVKGTINTYTPEANDEAEDTEDTTIDVFTEVTVNKKWKEIRRNRSNS